MSTGALEGQRGPVTCELASWGVRAVALLIDVAVFVGVAAAVSFGILVAEGDTEDARRLAEQLGMTILLPLLLLYAPLLLARGGERNGQTLGKQAMKIRVVRESGDPVTIGNAVLRETIGRLLLAAFTYGFYLLIDSAWPLADRARQCLHDKVAQTRVVRVQAVDAPVPPPQPLDERPVRDGWLPPHAGR